MNYDNENHIIEYIEGKKVKQFKVPKNDYNLDFNKMSYNDILTYIKLVQEDENKHSDVIKYKPLKTVAAKTKDYFIKNDKLMSQIERQQKIAEYIISDKPNDITEFLQEDTRYDNPLIKNLISSLFEKGYSNEKIKEILKENDYFEVNSIEINNCIIKEDENYYFEDYEFKNTIHDLLNDTRQISILKYNEIFIPVNNIYNGNIVVSDNIKNNKKFAVLNELLFKGVDFRSNEGILHKAFFEDKFVSRRDTQINYNKFVIPQGESSFNLNIEKMPFYLYDKDTKDKIYLNIQLLYYLLQFNLSFQNNNYKYIVEKINKYKEDKHKLKNVILIAGSAFDLDHIFDSLDEKNNDPSIDYYNEYINLFAKKITYLFNKHLKNYSLKSIKDLEPKKIIKPKTIPVYEPEPVEHVEPVKPVEPVEPVKPVEPVEIIHIKDDDLTDDDLTDNEIMIVKPDNNEPIKEAKGLFRRDTKETLKALLNRIIKLESLVSVQADEIKQLKNGIKSINQALPDNTRKQVFGNYFSNSINEPLGGALNPNKVYPKITFTEFKKLYNEL